MMEFDCDAPVISVLSKTEGRMNVSLLPCDSEVCLKLLPLYALCGLHEG